MSTIYCPPTKCRTQCILRLIQTYKTKRSSETLNRKTSLRGHTLFYKLYINVTFFLAFIFPDNQVVSICLRLHCCLVSNVSKVRLYGRISSSNHGFVFLFWILTALLQWFQQTFHLYQITPVLYNTETHFELHYWCGLLAFTCFLMDTTVTELWAWGQSIWGRLTGRKRSAEVSQCVSLPAKWKSVFTPAKWASEPPFTEMRILLRNDVQLYVGGGGIRDESASPDIILNIYSFDRCFYPKGLTI